MRYVAGKILTPHGLKKGYLVIAESTIKSVEWGICPKTPDEKGIITPGFINMHTHIGDAFIAKKHITLPHDILQLVAPPDGIKHRLLQKATDYEIIKGIQDAIRTMILNGTCCFVDFREDGQHGINLLLKAMEPIQIQSFILSRPSLLTFNENELQNILHTSDGIGLSSISDWNYEDILQIVTKTQQQNKSFALHVSERIHEDIDKIISLHPTFVVHMSKATQTDFIKINRSNIPIVICPQSNTFFNITPPLSLMKQTGNTILIGTDNAMLHSPNLINEIHHINTLAPGLFSLEELLMMITYQPRKVLNLNDDIPDELFPSSTYVVLDEKTLKPIESNIITERWNTYEN